MWVVSTLPFSCLFAYPTFGGFPATWRPYCIARWCADCVWGWGAKGCAILVRAALALPTDTFRFGEVYAYLLLSYRCCMSCSDRWCSTETLKPPFSSSSNSAASAAAFNVSAAAVCIALALCGS